MISGLLKIGFVCYCIFMYKIRVLVRVVLWRASRLNELFFLVSFCILRLLPLAFSHRYSKDKWEHSRVFEPKRFFKRLKKGKAETETLRVWKELAMKRFVLLCSLHVYAVSLGHFVTCRTPMHLWFKHPIAESQWKRSYTVTRNEIG